VIVGPSGDAYQLRYSSLHYVQGQPVREEREFFERVPDDRLPSPSEIARDSKHPYRPEPEREQDHSRGR
jgi:hypothetical protein